MELNKSITNSVHKVMKNEITKLADLLERNFYICTKNNQNEVDKDELINIFNTFFFGNNYNKICCAITISGKRCNRKAVVSKYCNLHSTKLVLSKQNDINNELDDKSEIIFEYDEQTNDTQYDELTNDTQYGISKINNNELDKTFINGTLYYTDNNYIYDTTYFTKVGYIYDSEYILTDDPFILNGCEYKSI